MDICRAGMQKNCNFISVPGKVRDRPEIGMKKCIDCGVKIHDSNIQETVSYETGTMWSHSPELLELKTAQKLKEDNRRALAIQELCIEYGLEQILDFGCGRGDLIELLKPKFQVSGFEIEQSAISILQEREIQSFSTVSELIDSKRKFDIVLAIHVLEHLQDPRYLFELIDKKLKIGGFLVIETPNANDALLDLYQCKAFQEFTYWSHHPTLHTNESVSRILMKAGYEVKINTGIQRYSLRNHLYWLSTGLPGGQEQEELGKFKSLEAEYEQILVHGQISDTLWAVAKKLK